MKKCLLITPAVGQCLFLTCVFRNKCAETKQIHPVCLEQHGMNNNPIKLIEGSIAISVHEITFKRHPKQTCPSMETLICPLQETRGINIVLHSVYLIDEDFLLTVIPFHAEKTPSISSGNMKMLNTANIQSLWTVKLIGRSASGLDLDINKVQISNLLHALWSKNSSQEINYGF